MDQFEPDQILESRLHAVQSTSTVESTNKYSFIDELASGNPTPGGGSAAAFTAAQAAALVAMVARVTVGKKKYAHVETQMLKLIEKAEALKTTLIGCVQEDADSFDGYIQATRLPKGTDEENNRREKAVEAATLHAAKVPRRVAGLAMDVLRMAVEAAELGNVNAISDAASAAHLAVAAVKGAGLNVLINQKGLKNPSVIDDMVKDLVDFEIETIEIGKRLTNVLQERAGL
jgi:glutamate formiminotransferase/formiminotetrahydrofolate cyclodeaminase